MKRYSIIFLVICTVTSVKMKSQDAHFSQYYSSPLYLSPSLAGATEDTRIILNYRNQWPGLSNAFINSAFSIDHYLDNFKSGIGINVIRSLEGGLYNTTNTGVLYNYTIAVNREIKIRPGIRAGYYFRNMDYNNIEFADQISRNAASTIEISNYEPVRHFDFSSSALIYSSFYWLGFTADHLLALNQQFATNPSYPDIKLSVYGGAQLKLFKSVLSKKDRTFSISFLYKKQSKFQQLDLGAYFEENPFRVGLFFRGVPVFNQKAGLNAIVLMTGYTWRRISINYSYDISTSRLLAASGGSHELSMAYKFKTGMNGKRKKTRAVPCPQF